MRKSMLCPLGTECHGGFFFFRLAGIMEGWSLLLQESPCLMEAGMAGWRADEGEEEVDGKGNSRSTAG